MRTDKPYIDYVSKCRRQREKIRALIQNIEIDKKLVFELEIKEIGS